MGSKQLFFIGMGIVLLAVANGAPFSVAHAQISTNPNAGVASSVQSYFSDIPVMIAIATCESGPRQFAASGAPLYSGTDGRMIGIFQIDSSIHTKPAEALGFDITTAAGNMGYARFLYGEEGTDPWISSFPCWSYAATAPTSTTISVSSSSSTLATTTSTTDATTTVTIAESSTTNATTTSTTTITPAPDATSSVVTATTTVSATITMAIATTTATTTTVNAALAIATTGVAPIVTMPTPNLTLNLSLGMIDPQVLILQQLLNRVGFTLATSGPGSPGNETTKFGSLTYATIKKFQCAEGIACSGDEATTGYGYLNAPTRIALLAMIANGTSANSTTPPSNTIISAAPDDTPAEIASLESRIAALATIVQQLEAEIAARHTS